MGAFTELNIAVNLKADKDTYDILKYMLGEIDVCGKLPDYELFKTSRWRYMLCSDSFYFAHTASSSLVNKMPYRDDHEERILNVRCDLKNYDDEIKKFLDWIYTLSDTRGFIGYMRYEEDKNPTLIYFTYTGIEYKEVD